MNGFNTRQNIQQEFPSYFLGHKFTKIHYEFCTLCVERSCTNVANCVYRFKAQSKCRCGKFHGEYVISHITMVQSTEGRC